MPNAPLPHPIRIAIIGTGDVARRRYLPALATLGDRVEVAALVDRSAPAAEAAATIARSTWPRARAFATLAEAVAAGLDAAVNLTPAPLHAAVTTEALDAGLHVYSEKPIAGTLQEADRLIANARARNLLLLCAPGEAVSRRGRWLADIVASNRLGPLTLAVAHHADSGPATWREYTGDPAVFYGPGVGPVFDHGIYRLHLMTTLLGSVRRVQAMGSISRPSRIVRGGPRTGQSIDVTAPDHVLINLEFDNGALGQLLASFGAANTKAPWLELHFTGGTLSYGGASYDPDATASIFLDDDSELGLEGWIDGLGPPPPDDGLGTVEAGILHFVACLRGDETPVLTAEHARHVLDIVLAGYASIEDGRAHETSTKVTGQRGQT
jgi:predicted dehydrogenase